jgi:AraC family ethanolamine operon transcriptional activator
MQVVLDSRFSNLEQFIQAADRWDLDFRLLGNGGFVGRAKQLISRDVLIGYARFQRSLNQVGSTPPGYRTFGILGEGCSGFWWRGHQVSNHDLLVFPPSNELRSASTEDFEVFTVSVRTTYLEQLAEVLELHGLLDNGREVVRLDPDTVQYLRSVAEMIVRSTGGAVMLAASQGLAEKLAICAARGHADSRSSSRKRDIAVNRVVDYINSALVPTSDLATLSDIAGVSKRTLQYAFKERFGIPPNVYVRRWKLNSVRRLILQADPEEVTISQIATNLGFSHLGQFSTDYRKLFAELPSTTLGSKHWKSC